MSGVCDACVAAGSTVYDCQTPHSGIEERAGDMYVYTVGEGTTAIIVGYDIFGFKIANARSNCDTLASAGQYMVIPPVSRTLQPIEDLDEGEQHNTAPSKPAISDSYSLKASATFDHVAKLVKILAGGAFSAIATEGLAMAPAVGVYA